MPLPTKLLLPTVSLPLKLGSNPPPVTVISVPPPVDPTLGDALVTLSMYAICKFLSEKPSGDTIFISYENPPGLNPNTQDIWESFDNKVSMTQSELPIKTCVDPPRWDPSIVMVSPLLAIKGETLVAVGVLEEEYVYDTIPSKLAPPDVICTLPVSSVPEFVGVVHLISLFKRGEYHCL